MKLEKQFKYYDYTLFKYLTEKYNRTSDSKEILTIILKNQSLEYIVVEQCRLVTKEQNTPVLKQTKTKNVCMKI